MNVNILIIYPNLELLFTFPKGLICGMHNSNLESYDFKAKHGLGSNSCRCTHRSYGVFGFA